MAQITQVQTIKQMAADNLRMRDTLERCGEYLESIKYFAVPHLRHAIMQQEVRGALDATLDPYEKLEKGD